MKYSGTKPIQKSKFAAELKRKYGSTVAIKNAMLKLFKQRSFHAFNQGISFGLLKVRRLNTKTLVWFKVPEQGF